MNSDEQQIRELVATWMAATKAGDIATVLSLMTDDVVFLVTGQEPFGKEHFAAALKPAASGASMPKIDGRSEIQEVQVSGNFAYMWSRLNVEMTMPDGKLLRFDKSSSVDADKMITMAYSATRSERVEVACESNGIGVVGYEKHEPL
jgi:uncharacterized protein (TIGR02246 family)